LWLCPPADADAGDAATCVESLSNVGTGDFTISFSITTTTTQASTIASQRQSCDGLHPFWDLSLRSTGVMVLEVSGAQLVSTRAINDGTTHAVVIQRRSLEATITIDGAPAGAGTIGTDLGALPMIQLTSGNPCESPGGRMPLVGMLSGFCLQE